MNNSNEDRKLREELSKLKDDLLELYQKSLPHTNPGVLILTLDQNDINMILFIKIEIALLR